MTNDCRAVTVNYCDVNGPVFPGTGNTNVAPGFETAGNLRLTNNAPCIDRGTTNSLPGLRRVVFYDMDGEARLAHDGGASEPSTTDIGADEFVYRLQFGTEDERQSRLNAAGNVYFVTNTVSRVDEASGVAFLGNDNQGRAVIAVVDDEQEDQFFVFTLNGNGVNVDATYPVSTRNEAPYSGAQEQVLDVEGITYNASNNRLYLITSNTKARQYRGMENTLLEPLLLAPTNDYDRRRNVLVQFAITNLNVPGVDTNATRFYEPEHVTYPDDVYTNATRGLVATIRNSLNTAPYTNQPLGNSLLIAWNVVNKFGAPVNGQSYASNDVFTGGGTVLGTFASGVNRVTHSNRTADTNYYYKSWIVGAGNTYREFRAANTQTRQAPNAFHQRDCLRSDRHKY